MQTASQERSRGRRLVTIALAASIFAACSRFDGAQVCDTVDAFFFGSSTTASYADVAAMTEQLAWELSSATESMRESALKEEARYAAFLARGVTSAVDARLHHEIIEEEIGFLVDSVLLVRYYCRESMFGGR